MPCNMLAVQAANIQASPQLIAALFANPDALSALAQTMANSIIDTVTVWNDTDTWWEGYRTGHQSVGLKHIARPDAQYMDFCSNSLTIRLHADGRIEARDGWQPGSQHPLTEQCISIFTMTAASVAVLVGQQLIAQTLANAGLLRGDDRTPTARVLTVAL